jgi:hypothetical protein
MVDKILSTIKVKWLDDDGTARLCDVLIEEDRCLVIGDEGV